jgi:prepilin-type processing-associated H-X9-DG protein
MHRRGDLLPVRDVSTDRGGFTILELFISIAIITVLVALVLPAVGSAREAARGIECANRLRQIGLALHAHHDRNGRLPAGWVWEPRGQSAYGWAAGLLPFLEESSLSGHVDPCRPLDNLANALARRTSLAAFRCPSDIAEPLFMLYEEADGSGPADALIELPGANYVGVFGTDEADESIPAPTGDGVFLEGRPLGFADVARGLSNTLFVGERTAARVPSTWLGVDARGEDAACRLVGTAFAGPNCQVCDECEFASRHPGGVNFLWGDGHVSRVSEQIAPVEYRLLARRAAE